MKRLTEYETFSFEEDGGLYTKEDLLDLYRLQRVLLQEVNLVCDLQTSKIIQPNQ